MSLWRIIQHFIQKSDAGDAKSKRGDLLLGKLVYFLGIMTIEPMMFVQGLASGISGIATEQMVLYKICRGKSIKPRPDL